MYRPLAVLTVLCSLVGCCQADSPLSDPATAEIDERLLGHWVTVRFDQNRFDPNVETHFFVAKGLMDGTSRSVMEVVGIEYDLSAKRMGPFHTQMSLTKVGDLKFMNVFEVTDLPSRLSANAAKAAASPMAQTERRCMVFRYEQDEQHVRVFSLNRQKAKELGKGGPPLMYSRSELLKLLEGADGKALFTQPAFQLKKAS